MTTPRGRTLPVLLAAVTLVGGANLAAYAANGKPLLLGKKNTETVSATVINKGGGPALKLKSKPEVPSLAVSSEARVAKLNADRVDGMEGAALQTTVFRYGIPSTTGTASFRLIQFPDLPAGQYLATYSLASLSQQTIRCQFDDIPGRGFSFSTSSGNVHSNNGTALVDTRDLAASISCYSGSSFNFYSHAQDVVPEVVFTRVDEVVRASPTLPRATRPRPTGPR